MPSMLAMRGECRQGTFSDLGVYVFEELRFGEFKNKRTQSYFYLVYRVVLNKILKPWGDRP